MTDTSFVPCNIWTFSSYFLTVHFSDSLFVLDLGLITWTFPPYPLHLQLFSHINLLTFVGNATHPNENYNAQKEIITTQSMFCFLRVDYHRQMEVHNFNFWRRLWKDSLRKKAMIFHRNQYRRHQKARRNMRINLLQTNTWTALILNIGLGQSGIIWLHGVVSPNFAQSWR